MEEIVEKQERNVNVREESRESVMQCRDYQRRKRIIMNVRLLCMVYVCCSNSEGDSEWIQNTSVDKMVTDK